MEQKYCGSFEMWCRRRMERISLTDRVRNEELQTVKEERNILQTIKQGRLTGLVISCEETAL
jgi:oligoribonuclease (3'-5' exoribonuclease)